MLQAIYRFKQLNILILHHHQVTLTTRISLILFLSILPYHRSLPTGLPNNIVCPFRAVVGKFLLVGQHRHVNVKKSIGNRYLWVRPLLLK